MKSLVFFFKFRSVFIVKKKMILTSQNARFVLWYVEKMVFGDKNSNLCLFDKIKSFDLKNIKSVFKNKKKNVF